jgi:predicted transcriptional regulator
MTVPKLSKLELEIMDVLWTKGVSSIREIQEALPGNRTPAYSTVQTMVYRLENKKAVRRAKKISNAHMFEAVISRSSAQRRWVGEFLGLFGGGMKPLMTHLIETGMLTLDDVQDAERTLRDLVKKGRAK